jgi:hypothetical protein
VQIWNCATAAGPFQSGRAVSLKRKDSSAPLES